MCHHFQVLPTDSRYKALTENQKQLLFTGWLELPTSQQIKDWHDSKRGSPVITKDDADNFKKLGYTASQIDHMKEQLEKAGFNQSE